MFPIDVGDALKSDAVVVALIGFGGVIVGAVVTGGTQFITDTIKVRREARHARDAAQVEALDALGDAALALREVLSRILTTTIAERPSLDSPILQAHGRFQVRTAAVLSGDVRKSAAAWYVIAEQFFRGDEGPTSPQEDVAWQAFVNDLGVEFRRRYASPRRQSK